MVHVRRKVVQAFGRTGAAIAREAIKRIAKLYAVEKEARGKSPEQRIALRQKKAKPVFDEPEVWRLACLPRLSGKTRLAGAMRYALNRMPKARAYLSDGRLELDNNICALNPSYRARPQKLPVHGVRQRGQSCRNRLYPH